MDNISVKWLSEDIDKEATGNHNGDNYFAYTFYLVNNGENAINYWYEIAIDDIIKDLDKAIRVMVYHNGEKSIGCACVTSEFLKDDFLKAFVWKIESAKPLK